MIIKITEYFIGDKSVNVKIPTKPLIFPDSKAILIIHFETTNPDFAENRGIIYISEKDILILDGQGSTKSKIDL